VGELEPRRKSDAIDDFLRAKKPDNAVIVKANWRDNPWFPDVLDEERRLDLEIYATRRARHCYAESNDTKRVQVRVASAPNRTGPLPPQNLEFRPTTQLSKTRSKGQRSGLTSARQVSTLEAVRNPPNLLTNANGAATVPRELSRAGPRPGIATTRSILTRS
jgi:hypothetical protein